MNPVENIEKILNYSFKNKTLVKDAVYDTSHPTIERQRLRERLRFLGSKALSLALTTHLYLTYPSLEAHELSQLRALNASCHRYANIAIKQGLYHCNGKSIDHNPKAYHSNIVKIVAGAVYIDVNFDVRRLWEICGDLFKPMYTIKDLLRVPLDLLTRFGDKQGKLFEIKYNECYGGTFEAQVYMEDELIVRGRHRKCRDSAKLSAAESAVKKLSKDIPIEMRVEDDIMIGDAKSKLVEICQKRKWPKPTYKLVIERGGVSEKHQYVCSATIETLTEEGTLCVKGDRTSNRKVAEMSSASHMIKALKLSQMDDVHS